MDQEFEVVEVQKYCKKDNLSYQSLKSVYYILDYLLCFIFTYSNRTVK
jgi:hypothetical protein